MPLKIRLVVGFVLTGILIAGFFISLRVKVKDEWVRKLLVPKLEMITEGTLRFNTFEFSHFPRLVAEMQDVDLSFQRGDGPELQAEKLEVHLRPFAALFGKTMVGAVRVREGTLRIKKFDPGTFKEIEIRNLSLQLDSVGSKVPIRLRFEGDLAGAEKGLSARGTMTFENWEKWEWEDLSFDGWLSLKEIPLAGLAKSLSEDFPAKLESGNLSGEIRLTKAASQGAFSVSGNMDLVEGVYQINQAGNLLTSPPLDAQLEMDFNWNPKTEDMNLKYVSFNSPIGSIQVAGRLLLGTGEVQDVRITASEIALESVPQYYLALKEAIPFNIGFSGLSHLDLSLSGTLDHLSLHANWDLSSTLFTYGRYFSKPKDLPASLVFDFLLKDGETLSGDFSLRLKKVSVKGSMADFDLKSAQGQLNVITNKFDLEGWEALLPPFENYQLGGSLKVLANFEGSFKNTQEMKRIWNVTARDVSLSGKSGEGIEGLSFALDYGPVALDIKGIDFKIGNSQVESEVLVYQFPEDPIATLNISSDKLEPFEVLQTLEALTNPWMKESSENVLRETKKAIEVFLPKGEALEKFQTKLEYQENEWAVREFRFEAYGGIGDFRAGVKVHAEPSYYWLDGEIQRLSLARFSGRDKQEESPSIGGNLFLNLRLRGEDFGTKFWWKKRLQGEGTFSVTNGEFSKLDLLGVISEIEEFSTLRSFKTGKTTFDDLRADFVLEDGNLLMEPIVMTSSDVLMDAGGEASFEGILNYRLNLYLSESLTEKILALYDDSSRGRGDRLLGPIPFLLTGPSENPELRADPSALTEIQDHLARRKTQKVLRAFLPETFFFEREESF